MDGNSIAGFSFLLVLFGIVLLICWTILPFAIIGTKPLLRRLIEEQRETNRLLAHAGEPSPAKKLLGD